MKQQTLAAAFGFERFRRQTRRAEFLSQMERVVPWAELVALIEPHYPKSGNVRPPVGLERMLRITSCSTVNLSDPAVEDALYDSLTMRSFVGIDLVREPAPDETTVCRFRYLLERQGHVPSSTKNKDEQRDPEMHQVKKGNQWYFGMKAHVGVDADTRLIHLVQATAANVAQPGAGRTAARRGDRRVGRPGLPRKDEGHPATYLSPPPRVPHLRQPYRR